MAPPQFTPEQIATHYSKFNIARTSFKAIDEQEIAVECLIPKSLLAGKYPVMVRFHGGGLAAGSCRTVFMFTKWILEYAIKHSAIIVCPDYRLLPESNGQDMLDDLSDFWAWFHRDLDSFVSIHTKDIQVDHERIMLQGSSAGAWFAVQTVFLHPQISVKAILAPYPMWDLKSPYFNTVTGKSLAGNPTVPAEVLIDHVASKKAGDFVTAGDDPIRLALMLSIIQQGRLTEFLGTERKLFPRETLGTAEDFPALFVFHGENDTMVPEEGAKQFVDELKRALPQSKVVYKTVPGEHGLDMMATGSEPWLQEGLKMITAEWLEK